MSRLMMTLEVLPQSQGRLWMLNPANMYTLNLRWICSSYLPLLFHLHTLSCQSSSGCRGRLYACALLFKHPKHSSPSLQLSKVAATGLLFPTVLHRMLCKCLWGCAPVFSCHSPEATGRCKEDRGEARHHCQSLLLLISASSECEGCPLERLSHIAARGKVPAWGQAALLSLTVSALSLPRLPEVA